MSIRNIILFVIGLLIFETGIALADHNDANSGVSVTDYNRVSGNFVNGAGTGNMTLNNWTLVNGSLSNFTCYQNCTGFSGNFSNSSYLLLAGGVMTGDLKFAKGSDVRIQTTDNTVLRLGANLLDYLLVGSPGGSVVAIGANNLLFPSQAISAPAYALGGLYYDTTINLLSLATGGKWLPLLTNQSLFNGGNLTISQNANGTLTMSTTGSNPFTADVNTSVYNITSASGGNCLVDLAGCNISGWKLGGNLSYPVGNQFFISLQSNISSNTAGASYERGGLYVRSRQYDASPNGSLTYDSVGIDSRSTIINNTAGRAWGVYGEAEILQAAGSGVVSDGYLVGTESEVRNAGTNQSAADTVTSKYGQRIIITNVSGTAAIYVDQDATTPTAKWWNGFYTKSSAIAGYVFNYVNGSAKTIYSVNQTGNITMPHAMSCIQMQSPDGTNYAFTIANGGTTSVVAGTCA